MKNIVKYKNYTPCYDRFCQNKIYEGRKDFFIFQICERCLLQNALTVQGISHERTV